MTDSVLKSAVEFLNDETIKNSSIDKKKDFLKSKGLTDEQIERAFLESAKPQSPNQPLPQSHVQPSFEYYAVPPPLPRRDWKDYLIMATSTAGVLYGCYALTKQYIIPRIVPKEQSQIDEDKKDIDAKFNKLDEVLQRLEKQEEVLKNTEQEKLKKLEGAFDELTTALNETQSSKRRMDNEFKLLKAELVNLQNTVDKFCMDTTRITEIEGISNEIKSLKLLVTKSKDVLPPATQGSTSGSLSAPNVSASQTSASTKVLNPSAVPSASDILSKMNLKPKSTTPVSPPPPSKDTPAWMKASTDDQLNKKVEIPEWQRALTSGNDQAAD